MNRFPDHARVVFIGDSITCGGIWIAHIYDYYLRHFPKSDIRMYNAGISGGSTTSALEYYDRGNGENYKPTHAVIMLGMNDVWRGLYEIKPEENDIADKQPAKRMEAIGNYEKRLRTLTSLLLERGVKPTFVTPTIYDESTDPRALDKIGCDAGLEYLGEINRRIAAQTGSDFVNLHAPIRFLNAAHPMIRADRVHPNEFGHVCMAHLFLAAQGLVDEPTALSVNSLPGWEELLPANRARYEAERKVRTYWNAEWLLLRDHPGTEEERRAYLKEFRKTAPNEFWTDLVDNYFAMDGDVKPAQEQEIACVEACLKQ